MKPISAPSSAFRVYLLLGMTLSNLPAVTLLSDDFTAAVRVGTAPTVTGVDRDGGSSNDYAVATNGSGAMATGVTNDRASNVGAGITGNSYFVTNEGNAYSVTTSFAGTSLAPGDSLSFSFGMRTSVANPTVAAGAFRFGLLNSGGTVLANNTSAFGGSGVFANDTGYIANISTTATGMSAQVQERANGSTTQNIFAGTLASVGAAENSTNFVNFDTNYTATLTLTLSLDGTTMTIDSAFNGLSLSRTDLTSPYTTFDTAAVFFGSQFGNATTPRVNFIDDVLVTTTVPEPGALALGSLGLLAALRRKR